MKRSRDYSLPVYYIKFDHCSFSRSRDMVGAHRNVNGSRDLTMPLSRTVCNPWLALAIINLLTKHEV